MAGDYIKWTHGLERKPKTIAIASALRLNPMHAAAMCMVFWVWCDAQATIEMAVGEDLKLPVHGAPVRIREMIDDQVVGKRGFASAMENVRWLTVRRDEIHVPRFFEMSGVTAKTRAENRDKKRRQRDRDRLKTGPDGAGQSPGSHGDRGGDGTVTAGGPCGPEAEAEQSRQSRAAESRESAEEFCSALPDGTPKALCSLLLAQMPAGIKPLDALAIAEEPRATRERVLWALDRLRDELRRADEKRREPIDNPAGWLRNLIAGEGEPSAKWRRTNMRRVLALGAAKDAAQARAAQAAGGTHG